MSIVAMTANARKISEYKVFFGRHAQTVHVEAATEDPAVLAAWLATARGVLADESNIYTPEGDLVDETYAGAARNVCRLHAWILKDGKPQRRSYLREVAGRFDGTRLAPGDDAVFGWDAAFTPVDGPSLHHMAVAGLKNSAREQCLSAFTRDFLRHKEPQRLRWQAVAGTGIVDWDTDARLLTEHPLFQNLPIDLYGALSRVVNRHGVLFRAATSRRDGNYWLPGLNGGIPYVPKSDPVHEATYLFHDVMHQLMPDLAFDGTDTRDHRRAYIGYRMMSEAVSLTLADMLFASHLAGGPTHADYDFTARRILPMYRALAGPEKPRSIEALLSMVTRYVVLGDTTGFPTGTEAWRGFEEKYARFFVGDFQWTRANWSNLVGRTDMSRRWIELVGPETLRAQGIELVSDVVGALGRGQSDSDFVDQLTNYVMRARLEPAFRRTEAVDLDLSFSNGFRRWLTGQCAFFARYAPIVGIPALGHELAARVRSQARYDRTEAADIRRRFGDHVRSLAMKGLISDDDAAMFPDLFPLFDPFFLRDYDRSEQEFATVAEASAAAFG